MKDSLLGIRISMKIERRFVEELTVDLTAKSPLLDRYIQTNVRSEYVSGDYFDDYSTLDPALRAFVDYFKRYDYNLRFREGASRMVAGSPVDYYFLERLMAFDAVFEAGSDKWKPAWSLEEKSLKLATNETGNRLAFADNDPGYLIATNAGNLTVNRKQIARLISPIAEPLVAELFRTGELELDGELKLRLLHRKAESPESMNRYVSLPEVAGFPDKRIVFIFHSENGIYTLRAEFAATEAGKTYSAPFDFRDIRKRVLLNEDVIVPFAKNKIAIVAPDSTFYSDIKFVNEEVFSNFFEFLNEIEGNVIQTADNENLFLKFFPKIAPVAEIRDGNKQIRIVFGKFVEKSVEIVETTPQPGADDFSPIDWLEVRFQFKIEDVTLNLAEIRELLSSGFLRKDDRLIAAPKDELETVRELIRQSGIHFAEGKASIRHYNLPMLLKEGMPVLLPETLKDLASMNDTESPIVAAEPPESVAGALRDYQKSAFEWLCFLDRYRFGGVLADEMGLGKTLEILCFLRSIRGRGVSIIICPSSLVYNWAAEIDKFLPGELRYAVVADAKPERRKILADWKNYDILITSYNLSYLDNEEYEGIQFQYCILDEAQHIKNKAAKRTQSIKGIVSKNRIAITGTPLENSIGELWSIFDFLMPGFLGTHAAFKREFETPIEGFDRNERQAAFNRLKAMIKPFVLRRTKQTVYRELPDKIEQIIHLELSQKQKAAYVETLDKVKNSLMRAVEEKGFEKSRIEFLAALTRLRQICLHPALVNPDFESAETDEISVKLAALIELLQESIDSGHRVLVFSQFVQMLKLIRKEFHKNEIEYFYLDGATKNRVDLVNEFNRSDAPVFLISLRAGGTGLNLVGADSVILFDPWWNPAVENQAIDRAHRIGQKSVVNVYRLLTRGTIEEKIFTLQSRKKAIFDSALAEDTADTKKLSWEDVKDLFDQPEEGI